jgi:hypothetical protein
VTSGAAAPEQQTGAHRLPETPIASGELNPGTASRPAVETCPLCATPLSPDQDWCLRCGAAARTRLAATPNWKAPILVVAVVAVLALGVLAAALVKLAGGSSAATAPVVTTTITAATAPAATAPAATTTPGGATTTPGVAGAQGTATVTTTPSPSNSPTVTTLTPAQREAERQAASPLSTK